MTAYQCFVKDFQQDIADVPLHKRENIVTPSKMKVVMMLIKTNMLKERRS